MKRDEILNMPAGRGMDYLIAEKVLNLSVLRDSSAGILIPKDAQVHNYSTDISAAWEVIQHFLGTSRKRPKIDRVAENEWRVQIDDWNDDSAAWSSSAPLAICRAALLAIMEGE